MDEVYRTQSIDIFRKGEYIATESSVQAGEDNIMDKLWHLKILLSGHSFGPEFCVVWPWKMPASG